MSELGVSRAGGGPITRDLPVVLRDALAEAPPVQVLTVVAGAAFEDGTPDYYANQNVVIGGVTIKIPRLQGAGGASPGDPVFVLVLGNLMISLGRPALPFA